MDKKISVLLVDDHAVVRTGYKTYLSLSEKVGHIYEADSGETACQLYKQNTPDIVVLDMSMPGIGGFEAMRRLISYDPYCKILVFSIHDELVFVARAIKSGAKGYIIKNSGPEVLTAAVCTIVQGGTYVAPELAQKLAMSHVQGEDESHQLKQLSAREFDIFCLLANGKTAHEIADSLCLSYKTVSNYSTSIKEKLKVKSLVEMVLIANRQGVINTIKQERL